MDNDASKDWEGPWPDRASAKPRDCPECPALCEQCSKVPFRGSELSVFSKPGRHSDTWYLGTFGDLRSRNCPFCQLVESVCWGVGHSWERLSKPDDSREVHVKWWEQYCGFGVTDLAPLGSFICFSDADEARLVRTKGALEGWINTDICKRWLSECEKRHRPECSPIPFNTEQLRQSDGKPLVMRLVDVEAMCIIDAPRSCRYLALSYVWGNPMDGRLVLNLNNRHALTKPHALRAHWDIIPKTISSAMKFVKDLGERYLWVDSLCLVQNDEKEVAECTRVMDKYYAMATLTIVPASGTDAYTGLPGVHPTPRKSTRLVREVLPGIRMTTMEDLDKVLRVSYYSRRGWTMQEELCSSRLLVFINNQVYYRCLNDTLNEDAAIGDRLGSHWHNFSLMPIIFGKPVNFLNFTDMLMYYMRRKLTYPSDILQACRGMLRKLTDIMGVELVEGLPTPLERYLLFSRWPPEARKGLRRRGFPSYSWTGWEYIPEWERRLNGREYLDYSRFIGRKDAKRTWITWYKRSSDGKLGEINAYENQKPSASKKPETTKEYTGEGLADHFQMDFSTADIPPNLDQLPNLAYDVLFFHTISVFLKLSVAQSSVDSQSHGKCVAYGIEETSFGEISLDADDIDVNTVQELALICEYEDIWDDRVDAGWWGILLRRIGPLAERRGILKIPMEILNKTLPPGPIWSCINLG